MLLFFKHFKMHFVYERRYIKEYNGDGQIQYIAHLNRLFLYVLFTK